MIAADFFYADEWRAVRPQISPSLERARVRANKEIAHLTSERLTGSPPEKRWDVLAVATEIRPIMDVFVQRASASRLSPRVASVLR